MSIPKLKDLAYYQTGGDVAQLLIPASTEDLIYHYARLLAEKKKHFFLGAGSNSLISDEPYDGAIVSLKYIDEMCLVSDLSLRCGGGVTNTAIAELLLNNELAGGEWLYFLPGQIAATTRMNARCFGGEISMVVEQVTALDNQGKIQIFSGSDPNIFRGYKSTLFMQGGYLIYEVVLKFKKGDPQIIKTKMLQNKTERETKGHFRYPSCGCVFKNDYKVGVPSGILLDRAGVKELFVGRAAINPDHANFIYNLGGAASEEILKLSFLMREKVYDMFGVWLEYEMEILGNFHPQLMQTFLQKKPHQIKNKKLEELRQGLFKL